MHKGGDRGDVNNYRPIAVLSALSKILEKIMNRRLIHYLNKYNILSESQYEFREGRSTEDAVIALTNEVVSQLDKGNKCIGVFIDLSKAFDTVSVPILLRKLENIGIRGTPNNLFRDYLQNRKQRVKVGPYYSNDEEINYGVPQGSVLGPTLFLIYVNELCNSQLNHGKIFSYADDTALIFHSHTWEDVKLIAEEGLSKMSNWLKDNLLTLNTNQTNYLTFSITNQTQPPIDLSLKVHKCNDNLSNNCMCDTI